MNARRLLLALSLCVCSVAIADTVHYPDGDELALGGITIRGQKPDGEYLKTVTARQLFDVIRPLSLKDYAMMRAVMNGFPKPIVVPKAPSAPNTNDTKPSTDLKLAPSVPLTLPKVEITDELRRQYAVDISKKLNQYFILQSIADVLDSEAYFYRQTEEVPLERLNYAARKLLVIDNKKMSERVFRDFVLSLIKAARETEGETLAAAIRAELAKISAKISKDELDALTPETRAELIRKAGEAARPVAEAAFYSRLAALGIDKDVVAYFERTLPFSRDADQVFATFKQAFDRRMLALLERMGSSVRHLPADGFGKLPASILAYYADVTDPTDEERVLFERLRDKVGDGPYRFVVRWKPGDSDPKLWSYAKSFSENWPKVTIEGQLPANPTAEPFPATYEKFRQVFLAERLTRAKKYLNRQKVTNTLLARHWPDLFGPFSSAQPRSTMELYSAIGPARFPVYQGELEAAYEEAKDQVAAHVRQELTLTEIKLGDNDGVTVPTRSGRTNVDDDDEKSSAPQIDPRIRPCVGVFKQGYAGQYEKRQQDARDVLVAKLAAKEITQQQYYDAILQLRLDVPAELFEPALKAARAYKDEKGQEVCKSFAARLEVVRIHFDNRRLELSEDDRMRLRFVSEAQTNEDLRNTMIPHLASIDRRGNVHHYFFHKAADPVVEYLPLSDAGVSAAVRGLIAGRRVARMLAKAVELVLKADDMAPGETIRSEEVLRRRAAEQLGDPIPTPLNPANMRRYVLHARKEAFSYRGADGFRLSGAAGQPAVWLPKLFIGKSTEIFERAFDMP